MADVAYAFAVPFDPSSVGRARAELREWLRPATGDAPLVDDAALVLSELVTNALRHARPTLANDIGVEMQLAGDRLHMAVTDGGAETVPEAASSPQVSPGGRGLFIVGAVADQWWWEPADPGLTVHAVLRSPSGTD